MSKLLLLSNSTMPGTPFLDWPTSYIKEFLAGSKGTGVFIPFAGVTFSFDKYAEVVDPKFEEMGYPVKSIHHFSDAKKALEEAAFIVVGGGNSFALLSRMYEKNLLEVVQRKVAAGTPYLGWSASANLACPTIMTTNDMPVVQPPSLNALNLVPFQLNPHYHELRFEGQGGETRRERLEEFLVMNPDKKVIGLPDGMLLHREGSTLTLKGNGVVKLYELGHPLKEYNAGSNLSFLLK